MTTGYAFATTALTRAMPSLSLRLAQLSCLAMLSGPVLGAEPTRVVQAAEAAEQTQAEQEVQREIEIEREVEEADQQALTGQPASQTPLTAEEPSNETTLDSRPRATHATQEAPDDLMEMAAHQPELFVGKTLVLVDGAKITPVGRVLAMRKRLEDQHLYLIVDATQYFNSPTEYAVAVKDVARLEGDRVIIPEAPGMHLKGMEYYAKDYNDEFGADAEPPATP
ncbi:MAG: hypothetical protein V4603_11620 [Pseudomonadota bacterium]